MSYLERKTVEMSVYIPIHEYDQHEEKHAFFAEMMSTMIQMLEKAGDGKNLRILEFGAGTGLFTQRLASSDLVSEVVAVEFDWACCEVLRHKMRGSTKVRVEYQDSRVFSPEGSFDAVVSSFADHHIRPVDKPSYFRNVIQNMKNNALFIVGDEFLPEYDLKDELARCEALKKYHNYIIERAKSEGETVLMRLEEAALESGLNRVGDFKVPCTQYEQMLKEAKLTFTKNRIGPTDRDDVGGVYVYRIQKLPD
jgi:cyclopropane fatty-acyl-phospholipid synthase-like methyltransferase